MRISVDFPAPLGPSRPYMPGGMVRLTSLRARTPFGYVLEMLRMLRCTSRPRSGGEDRVLYNTKWTTTRLLKSRGSSLFACLRRPGSLSTLLDPHEGEAVVRVHRDHQLIRAGVVAHGGGTGNVPGDELGRSSGTDARDTSLPDAAHVLRPIRHDHETIAPRLRGLLGAEQPAGRRQGQHRGVADVDDDDIPPRIEGDAVRLKEWCPLHEDRCRAVWRDLPDLPRRGIRRVPKIPRARGVDR